MAANYRLKNRVPEKDDSFILNLIQDNLTNYPTAFGWTEQRVIHLLDQSSQVILLVSSGGERIGFLSWVEKPPVIELGLCVLKRSHQGKGIASRYLRRLERYCSKRGFTKLSFHVDKKNKGALRLYQRQGFQIKHSNPLTRSFVMEKHI
jgi:ribosomal protein S18 acetylase RimI-like enzyme